MRKPNPLLSEKARTKSQSHPFASATPQVVSNTNNIRVNSVVNHSLKTGRRGTNRKSSPDRRPVKENVHQQKLMMTIKYLCMPITSYLIPSFLPSLYVTKNLCVWCFYYTSKYSIFLRLSNASFIPTFFYSLKSICYLVFYWNRTIWIIFVELWGNKMMLFAQI